MKNGRWNNKKIALLGLFASLAIIFGYVESLIPPVIGVPGIKLGLANLAILYILYRYSFLDALIVSVIRIFVIGFMFGSLSAIMYSLAGAILSMIVMILLLKKTDFSLIGVSVAGSVTHNMGQLLLAMCGGNDQPDLLRPGPHSFWSWIWFSDWICNTGDQ